MADWASAQLDTIARADELKISVAHADGRAAPPVPIWVVRVGDELFVRSYRGSAAAWYRRATAAGRGRIEAGGLTLDVSLQRAGDQKQDAIDLEYRRKYGRYGDSYVEPMTADAAQATTLVVRPL